MSGKKVLTVIVTYNAMPWYDKVIESLLESRYPSDILVVDNCSTDETVAHSRGRYPAVKLIRNDDNLGFGRANNIGLSMALEQDYQYAFLLNQDAWVASDTVGKLVAMSETHPEFGILSPMHMNGDGTMIDHLLYRNVAKHPCGRRLFSDVLNGKASGQVYDLTFVNCAAWLITRSCLQRVGFFDPIFKHYGEDNNYCHRAEYHGFKIGIVPDAVIYHDRENRAGLKPVWADNTELELKLSLANVLNEDPDEAYGQKKRQLVRSLVKSLFSGNFEEMGRLIERWRIMKKMFPEARESYRRNRKPAF